MSDFAQPTPVISAITTGEIWVVDPASGQQVNVQALFKTMHEFEPGCNAPLTAGALDSIKRILRFLSVTPHDPLTTDPVELSNIFNDLWRLLDMFETIGVRDLSQGVNRATMEPA